MNYNFNIIIIMIKIDLNMKKAIIYFFLLIISFSGYTQNKQNKYYKPYRLSIGALTKLLNSDFYNFDYGAGTKAEIIYTLDQSAKFEASIEVGYIQSFSKESSDTKGNGQLGINLYYYFIDDTFSPFIGIGYDLEYFFDDPYYKKAWVVKPFIGLSNDKLSFFIKYGTLNNIIKGIKFNSLEIGLKYSFKERPCGCFSQSK